MRKQWCVWICVFVLGVVCSAAQRGAEGGTAAEQRLGTWTGTWEGGGGSGGFELTLEKGQEIAVTGRVSVTGEPTYKAAFKTLTLDDRKMTAKYDFPPDERAEVVLAATFDGASASGTWSLRDKSNDNEVASGTWTVKKK